MMRQQGHARILVGLVLSGLALALTASAATPDSSTAPDPESARGGDERRIVNSCNRLDKKKGTAEGKKGPACEKGDAKKATA
jgi:hypothetical protein